MRVVVSFVGGWGHAEPLLPIAAWAKRLGHHVTFAGQAALGERLVRLGYQSMWSVPTRARHGTRPLVPIDREAERAAMRDHFIAGFGQPARRCLGGTVRP